MAGGAGEGSSMHRLRNSGGGQREGPGSPKCVESCRGGFPGSSSGQALSNAVLGSGGGGGPVDKLLPHMDSLAVQLPAVLNGPRTPPEQGPPPPDYFEAEKAAFAQNAAAGGAHVPEGGCFGGPHGYLPRVEWADEEGWLDDWQPVDPPEPRERRGAAQRHEHASRGVRLRHNVPMDLLSPLVKMVHAATFENYATSVLRDASVSLALSKFKAVPSGLNGKKQKLIKALVEAVEDLPRDEYSRALAECSSDSGNSPFSSQG